MEGGLNKAELLYVLAYGPKSIPEEGFTEESLVFIMNSLCQGTNENGELYFSELGWDEQSRGIYAATDVNRYISSFTDFQYPGDTVALALSTLNYVESAELYQTKFTSLGGKIELPLPILYREEKNQKYIYKNKRRKAMMNRVMKQAAAMLMIGMMTMTTGGNTAQAGSDSSSKEIEGWEVVGTARCTPIEGYEGTLDESAPSKGYVLDVQLVNSDMVDYYVSPQFYFDLVRESDGKTIQAVLVNSENVYTPDFVLWPFNICVQETIQAKAGQVTNVQYYIDGEGTNYLCYPEYAQDPQGAYENLYSFSYGAGFTLENPEVYCYLETFEEASARYEERMAQYENGQQYENDQQYDNGQQYENGQSNDKDALLDEIVGGLLENSINYFGDKVEESTHGIVDQDILGKAAEYLFGN